MSIKSEKTFPWVTRDFILNLINNSENTENIILKSFRCENALLSAENFSSLMIRLTVEYVHFKTKKQDVFIIKKALESEEFDAICKESALFEKEIEVYTKVLPAVGLLLNSIGENGQIAPRCFMGNVGHKIMVFDDLNELKFRNVNKTLGLDIDHMKIVLSTLAKWHAATSILLMKNPELFYEHLSRAWLKDGIFVKNFFKNVAKIVSNAARNWHGYEQIAEKIANIPGFAYDNAYKAYSPTEGGFNTLIHGDMWMGNIMFCHDFNGKPTDVRFVDFTLGKYTNPSIDLVCLLYGCSHQALKQRHREELIQFYHHELIQLLIRLKYPKDLPSLLDIQTAAFRVDLYNALIVLFVIGLRYVKKSDDFTNLVDEHKSEPMFSDPECISKLKYMLNLFDRRGYFDFN